MTVDAGHRASSLLNGSTGCTKIDKLTTHTVARSRGSHDVGISSADGGDIGSCDEVNMDVGPIWSISRRCFTPQILAWSLYGVVHH